MARVLGHPEVAGTRTNHYTGLGKVTHWAHTNLLEAQSVSADGELES
jgi:hypothetical protein